MTREAVLRKFAYAITALVLLLALLVLAAPVLVPAGLVKARLEAAASDRLGRPVTINGPLRFAIFPQLRLEAKDVSIANAPDAGGEPMARLGALALDLDLLPLLAGSLSIDRLELVDPVIALTVDAQGRPNWATGTAAAAPGETGPQRLSLGTIRLANGKITYLDQRSGKSQTAEQIDLDLSLPSLDDKLIAEGGLVWNGRKISLSLGIDQPRAFLAGNESGVSARLAGPSVATGFKGSVALEPRLVLKGDVEADGLDLNSLFGGPAAKPTPGWSDTPIDLSVLDAADAQLSLKLGGFDAGRISIGQSQLGVTLKNGKLSADIAEMALYQGNGSGHMAVDSSGVWALDCTLHQIAALPFFKATIDFARVTGTGDITLALTSRGKSERALIGALTGKASFALENGTVLGADLGSMFRNIASAFLDANSGKAEQTAYRRLNGTLIAVNGLVRNQDLAMRAADLDVGGSGTIDLPHRAIDYRLMPHLSDIGGLTVPLLIRGDLDRPDYEPDLSGALEHGVSGALKAGNPENLLNDLFGGK